MTVVAARYDSGDTQIPPLPFLYSSPNDTAQHVALTNPLMVTVHTVPLDTSGDIRDVKPPFSIPLSLAEVLLYLGIALAVTLAAYYLYRFWLRRKGKAAGGQYAPPPRPAHVIALEELAVLKEKNLWQRGLIKEYYSEVTEILRRYFENRYRRPALEETTDEIIAGLRNTEYPAGLFSLTETVLRRADLVKFAKQRPSIPEHEQMLTAVYDIVDATKSVGMTPVTTDTVQEPADVAR
jgi:hypothetical protein